MEFTTSKIRNVAVLGHQGSGKTSLVESLAFKAGLIKEKGSIERKNTISDYLEEEKKRQISMSASIVPLLYNDHKINLIDIPGNDDYISEVLGVTKSIKGAVLVVDASSGVEVGTIKHFKQLRKRGIPTFIFVNKMDKISTTYEELFQDIRNNLGGKKCIPFSFPLGNKENFDGFVNVVELKARRYENGKFVEEKVFDDKKSKIMELHNDICEAVASSSDELLEKFFMGETLTREDIKEGLRTGVLSGELFPVLVGCSLKDIGTNTLLNMLIDYLPSPEDLKPYIAVDENGNEVEVTTKVDAPTSLYIFKSVYDKFKGLISIFKVNSGVVSVGDTLYCPNLKRDVKISSLFTMCGNKFENVDKVVAGDIACTAKLEGVRTGYTLCQQKTHIEFSKVNYPTATYFKALVFTSKKDSEKFFPTIEKLMYKDPSIALKENNTTNQILVGGLSSTHLQQVLDELKNDYDIHFTLENPKIVYKETITKMIEGVDGKYVKQSGGAGAYGVVVMKFEPAEETSFESTVFGGHIDKGYFPAIEKGFLEALETCGITKSPIINVKATVQDGKQHPVDSNELAFKNAAIAAFKSAYPKCGPIILEPIDKVVINIQPDYLGTILSDLNKRRARILSTDEDESHNFDVVALVPESEITEYVNDLKAMTKGTGFFNMQFESYEKVPEYIQQKIVAQYKD